MRLRRTAAVLVLTLALFVGGCSCAATPTPPPTPPVPATPERTPVATATVGISAVQYLESHGDRVLAASVDDAAVTLLTREGRELFVRRFEGWTLASLRLSPTGDRVFVSLMRSDGNAPAKALWLDDTGKTLWERSGKLEDGLYDANIATDGRRLTLVVLAASLSPSGMPAFQILDDTGKMLATSPKTRAAVTAVRSSGDLSRHVVTSATTTDTTGGTPPDTVVERFERAKRVSREVSREIQKSVYLSLSGDLILTTDGKELSLAFWEGAGAIWEQPTEAVSQAGFSSDGKQLFLMRLASISDENGDDNSYRTDMEVRDSASGNVVWSTTVSGPTAVRPVASPDLSSIALVPVNDVGDAAIYELKDASYVEAPLPYGTTAACFTDDGRLVLGAPTSVSLY